MKVCMDCKYCSYNKVKKELDNMNWFKKFLFFYPMFYIFLFKYPEYDLNIQKEYCVCLHPNVFKREKRKELVSGSSSNEEMYCTKARTSSYETNDFIYSCCGVEGKYFENK